MHMWRDESKIIYKLLPCTDLLTDNGSLQILNDDEVSGSRLQFAVLYTSLNTGENQSE